YSPKAPGRHSGDGVQTMIPARLFGRSVLTTTLNLGQSFLASGAALTFITSFGLIAAITATITGKMPGWAIFVCWLVGGLGVVLAIFQWREGYRKIKQRDAMIAWAAPEYARFPEDWKNLLEEMRLKGSVSKGSA